MRAPARIGIFGGSFDPVHTGHIVLAQQACQQFALDTVYFVPAKQPPHKLLRILASARHRVTMLKLACRFIPCCRICHFELKRPGTTFTWQTVSYFRKRFPRAELFFILGSDSLNELRSWQNPERIAALCTILTGTRTGETGHAPSAIADRVAFITGKIPPVSSTDIRIRIKKHSPVTPLVPRAVARYIAQHNIYENP